MNPKRSKRTAAMATKSEPTKPEDANDASDDEFLELAEDGEPLDAKKTRGKKRKAAPKTSQAVHSASKKPKGIRGKLKDLIEMPIDVLFEIFSQMNPLDLVHLARTSKDLRATLIIRSSASIWRSARANFLPHIPECPEDLSEPVYAELLFGKSCHCCQRNITVHHAWHARKRICSKCLSDHCERRSPWYPLRFNGVQVPYLCIEIQKKHERQKEQCHFDEIRDAWKIEYEKLGTEENKNKWVEALRESREKIGNHARLCEVWFPKYLKIQETEVTELLKRQQALLAKHVEALGWADEVSKMPSSVRKFQDLPVLMTMEVKINAFMEDVKEKRLSQLKAASLRTCLQVYKEAYTKHMVTISDAYTKPHLTVAQLLLEPAILNILTSLNPSVDKPLTPDDLAPIITAVFPDATERLRQRVNSQLITHLRNTLPAAQDISEESGIFDLATTVFARNSMCRLCLRRGFWYEDIIAHSCDDGRGYIPPIGKDIGGEETLDQILVHIKCVANYYSIKDRATVDVKAGEVVSKLITLCGHDPLKTTKQMMNDLDPIFECIGCNSQERGRVTMTWSAMVSHYQESHTHHSLEPINPLLLTGNEADTARKRIAEQQARAWAANDPCIVACGHCGDYQPVSRLPYDRQDLVAHIKSIHGKARITDKDLIPRPDCRKEYSSIFYMWPPRPENDET